MVMVRVDDEGRIIRDWRGRVNMVYKPGGKVYHASLQNLYIDEKPAADVVGVVRSSPDPPAPRPRRPKQRRAPAAAPVSLGHEVPGPGCGAEIWTDGACIGNPGPAGAGVLLRDRRGTREVSRYLGHGTNNIGELTAIEIALDLVEDPGLPVLLYSDSTYALGVLGRGFKARKNKELIARIIRKMSRFARIDLLKVPAHAGVVENERVDWLASTAVRSRKDQDLFHPVEPATGHNDDAPAC